MKIRIIAAQRLLGALRTIDQAETVKLPGQLRFDIARNIDRLLPDVNAYEKAIGAKHREMQSGPEHAAANNAIIAEIEKMSEAEVDVKLRKLAHLDFRLDDNPRITGDMIASLAPILRDFDTVSDGDE